MISENLKTFLSDEVMAKAPVSEPERQRYFIERLKGFYSAEGGAGLKSCIVTFGCQMNARDSEKLDGILSTIGFKPEEDEQSADIVLFNTCTIRENANEHLYGRLGRLKQVKRSDPDRIIGICGCMMQEADEIETIKKKYPYVDIIFGTHNFHTFPELLFKLLRKREGIMDPIPYEGSGLVADSSEDALRQEKLLRYGSGKKELDKLNRKPIVSVWTDSSNIVEELPSRRKFPFKQGINIMFGCNNFCSYCIVPYVRGREKSRRPEDIYEEIKRSAAEGVKEIMLLGQNVNSYDGGIRFPELLKNIDGITKGSGIERIRFMTSHPKDLSDELIDVMAGGERICRQFHLPMQSGSDAILKRMNRHYDKHAFMEKADKLKSAMPDISLSTDIIVGFPGETERDFEDTLDVVRYVRFDAAYTFIYSKRNGTPAASYTDQVDEALVKDRFDRLLELQNGIAHENLSRLTGTTGRVLFESISEYDDSLITGKLDSGVTVHAKGDISMIGEIHDVRLLECRGFYYIGEVFE